jgi:hypothetical protein
MDHLRKLKLANFVMAGFQAAGLVFGIIMIVAGFFLLGDDPELGHQLIQIGFTVAIQATLFGAAHIVIGYLVGSGRGRVPQTIIAVLMLGGAPIGTIYGLYALWVCWLDAASKARFEKAIKPPIT